MGVEVFSPAGSTFIDELEFDDDASTLTITFSDGAKYAYSGVTRATYRNFTLAPSLGGFFHRHIKDRYLYESV